jgi:uncharacterized Ntn-hydrolase superfamily protein
MTFSILARDPETGAIGGAAATGSLCVGGWVLRGDVEAGMSASQGAAPSTFWGEDVLRMMKDGVDAQMAVEQVSSTDKGRDYRQLAALDVNGRVGAFTGKSNEGAKGSVAFVNGIVTGNMLAHADVLEAMIARFDAEAGALDCRLLAALDAANAAGGDFRGLLSAALLVLHPDCPPLTLRIDHHPHDPIGALRQLRETATTGDYADWVRRVPVASDRERILD